ncbi:MAG: hypothetical protein HY042_07400, partial [Spirochaetia bacterium]|nr:hypothetical protein [Spirochaetia bacterium]
GRDGILYRFSPDRKVLTGSLRGPLDELRGLTFAEGQLWIVNRKRQTLERLPYTETDRYIASGEHKYSLRVKVTFSAPPRPGGRILVLTPPSTESQKTRGISALSPGWSFDSFTASGERVFSRENGLPGERITLEYKASITAQNVRYLVPDDYAPGPEKTDGNAALSYFYDGSERSFQNDDPYVTLKALLIAYKLPINDTDKLLYDLKKSSLPARWTRLFKLKDAKFTPVLEAHAYLRGLGWIPVNPDTEGRLRVFERKEETIEIYREPDRKASGASAVYHVSADTASGAREMTSIPAIVEVNLEN